MADGYIKLQRKLFSSNIWLNGSFDYGKAWVDLIAMANYADTEKIYKGKYQKIKRGQIVTSQRALAERWNWSRGRVSNYLSALKQADMITTEQATNYTTITIVNYRVYQDTQATKKPRNDHEPSHEMTTKWPQNDTQEEYKERKKENNIIRVDPDAQLLDYGGLFLSNKEWDAIEAAVGPAAMIEYVDKVAEWLADNPRQKKTHANVLKTFLRNDGLIK